MRILVTGGAGFIGSALIRYVLKNTIHSVINVDKLTYASDLNRLEEVAGSSNYTFIQADITDFDVLSQILATHQPEAIMHLAAESHVDRSIADPENFIQTNIVGTYHLLKATYDYWVKLSNIQKSAFRFHHISTDEVYGSLGAEGFFTEKTPYDPRSPYSASKAASDHLVMAWYHTYGFPVLMTNCSNNYGPHQHSEKLIPTLISSALSGKPLPIYGDGLNIRDWLYVDDHVRALLCVLEKGKVGETYNVGGNNEHTNLSVVKKICAILDAKFPDKAPHEKLISFVPDRLGHDRRYAIDSTKIHKELGWQPEETFETGLQKTVEWYLNYLSK